MPTITGVNAQGEGGTLTLAGNGFGNKASPGPLVFEKFDGGRLTSTLTNNATGGEMSYDETTIVRPRRTHSARADYSKTSGADGQWASWQLNTGTAPRWFVSWYVYLPDTWHWGLDSYGGADDGLANIKIVRFFPTGSNYTNIDAVLHAYDHFNWKYAHEHETSMEEAYLQGLPNFDQTFSLNAWHKFVCEFGENSGLDARDGVFRIRVDTTPILDDHAVITNSSGDSSGYQLKRPYVIGFWDSWGPVPNEMPAYFADIIVDDSWARVELGDQPTWENCATLEYQPATAWSDGAITCTVNYGALTEGGTIFAFVTDERGQRSAGVPLGAGDTAPPTGPPPEVITEPPPEVIQPPTGGPIVMSTTTQLDVVGAHGGDRGFAISIAPPLHTITPGETATYQVVVTPTGGFDGVVTFSVSGASTKTSESFDPPSVTGGGTSTLTIVSTAETPHGTNTVTVTGTSG